MSKHIKKFENETAYNEFKAGENFILPNLSWCVEQNSIKSEAWEATPQHDYSNDYLTIVSTSDNNTIGLKANSASIAKTISVSTDGGQTWTDKTSNIYGVTLATLNTGDKLLIKGSNTAYGESYIFNYLTSTGQFNVEGNIMSLIYGDNFIGRTILPLGYTFYRLFGYSNVVDASNLVLPATTLKQYCYQYMFYGCASLTIAPVLPAATLATHCYYLMFYGCTNLNYIKCLARNISASNCTRSWVDNVAASGTFVKDPLMNNWTDGISGIPTGWTVVDYAS